MPTRPQCARQVLRQPLPFLRRVLLGFKRNQGLLLAGAVAYYALLSIVPLFALLLVGLSGILDHVRLLETVEHHLALLVPGGDASALTRQVENFLAHPELISGFSLLVLVFFSSLAFTVVENAMSVIFFHRVAIHRRHFLISAVLPYLFILLLGVGVLAITLVSGALQAVEHTEVVLFGMHWALDGISGVVLYVLGVAGLALLLTAFYLVMPVGRIAPRHALIGGAVAALLWEIARHVLVWYFSTLSFVNLIYGSLATAIIALIGLEVAAIILLLGAQVIAEFERSMATACGEREAPEEWRT